MFLGVSVVTLWEIFIYLVKSYSSLVGSEDYDVMSKKKERKKRLLQPMHDDERIDEEKSTIDNVVIDDDKMKEEKMLQCVDARKEEGEYCSGNRLIVLRIIHNLLTVPTQKLRRQFSERLATKPLRTASGAMRRRSTTLATTSTYHAHKTDSMTKRQIDDTTPSAFERPMQQRTIDNNLDTLLRLRRRQNVYELSKIGMDTLFNSSKLKMRSNQQQMHRQHRASSIASGNIVMMRNSFPIIGVGTKQRRTSVFSDGLFARSINLQKEQKAAAALRYVHE